MAQRLAQKLLIEPHQRQIEEGRGDRKQLPILIIMEEITHLYKEFRTIDGIGVCKVYFINGIAFSFDEDDTPDNLQTVSIAEEKPHLSNEDLYKGSSYLLEEGFELDILLEDINDDLFNDHEDDSPYQKIPKRY